jgi:hypothetical protein
MARTHEVVKCREHGTVQAQCRCPADNKTVILADCQCTPEQIAISAFPKAVMLPPSTPQPEAVGPFSAGQKIADMLNGAADLDQRRQLQIRRQRDSIGRLLEKVQSASAVEIAVAVDEIAHQAKQLAEQDSKLTQIQQQVLRLPDDDETRIAVLAILADWEH